MVQQKPASHSPRPVGKEGRISHTVQSPPLTDLEFFFLPLRYFDNRPPPVPSVGLTCETFSPPHFPTKFLDPVWTDFFYQFSHLLFFYSLILVLNSMFTPKRFPFRLEFFFRFQPAAFNFCLSRMTLRQRFSRSPLCL